MTIHIEIAIGYRISSFDSIPIVFKLIGIFFGYNLLILFLPKLVFFKVVLF